METMRTRRSIRSLDLCRPLAFAAALGVVQPASAVINGPTYTEFSTVVR